jgi:hypothetical protein
MKTMPRWGVVTFILVIFIVCTVAAFEPHQGSGRDQIGLAGGAERDGKIPFSSVEVDEKPKSDAKKRFIDRVGGRTEKVGELRHSFGN